MHRDVRHHPRSRKLRFRSSSSFRPSMRLRSCAPSSWTRVKWPRCGYLVGALPVLDRTRRDRSDVRMSASTIRSDAFSIATVRRLRPVPTMMNTVCGAARESSDTHSTSSIGASATRSRNERTQARRVRSIFGSRPRRRGPSDGGRTGSASGRKNETSTSSTL